MNETVDPWAIHRLVPWGVMAPTYKWVYLNVQLRILDYADHHLDGNDLLFAVVHHIKLNLSWMARRNPYVTNKNHDIWRWWFPSYRCIEESFHLQLNKWDEIFGVKFYITRKIQKSIEATLENTTRLSHAAQQLQEQQCQCLPYPTKIILRWSPTLIPTGCWVGSLIAQ